VVHLDPHGTTTQKHSAVRNFLGDSVVRTVEELCLSGHKKEVSFKKENLLLHSVFYQWIEKLGSKEIVGLDKKLYFRPFKNPKLLNYILSAITDIHQNNYC